MPYQQYLKEKTFSYAQLFKSLGYDTLGVHTYQKTFYERDRAYPLMGYDDFLGEMTCTQNSIGTAVLISLTRPLQKKSFISWNSPTKQVCI